MSASPEYKVSAANRKPEGLAAPDDAISTWVKEQIKRVQEGKLSPDERQHAAWNLGRLVGDARPIFCILTNEGALDLDQLIAAICRDGRFVVPVYSFSISASERQFGGASIQIYPSDGAPEYQNELYIDPNEMEFSSLTVVSPLLVSSFVCEVDDKLNLLLEGDELYGYQDLLPILVKTLTERNVEFEVRYAPDVNLGRYRGLDSPRHSLKNGDSIVFAALQIILTGEIK
ncbi:hypothetical protein ACU4GH_22180 [Bradyrhizobium betae]